MQITDQMTLDREIILAYLETPTLATLVLKSRRGRQRDVGKGSERFAV